MVGVVDGVVVVVGGGSEGYGIRWEVPRTCLHPPLVPKFCRFCRKYASAFESHHAQLYVSAARPEREDHHHGIPLAWEEFVTKHFEQGSSLKPLE